MCRIVGFVDYNKKCTSESILINMRDSMSNGGPDGHGHFIEKNIGLAHRRLSIIDLSNAGSQPMKVGKWVISYNGEVYNYLEIKELLLQKDVKFKSHTDTEVIVRAFEYFGIDSIKLFRGMFAFALFNTENKQLYLCRDRLGVKPLYFYYKDDLFLFSSEIKAFHHHPDFDKTINKTALPHFFQKGFINPIESIFTYVKPVIPGTIMEFDTKKFNFKYHNYWDLKDIYKNSEINLNNENSIIKELDKKLTESFCLRMIADVEVGVFLSGGIDSSLVASIIQKNTNKKIQTFTIGFDNKKYDESEKSKKISEYLGTIHTNLICSKYELESSLALMPEIFDEPFGDSSAIPTYLVSKLASSSVKVALSGDGGDELFGGYTKYKFAKYSNYIINSPLIIRKLLYNSFPILQYSFLQGVLNFFLKSNYSQIDTKIFKFKEILLANDLNDFIFKSSTYLNSINTGILTNQDITQSNNFNIKINHDSLITYFGLTDMLSYMPGDILTKVDRTSMYVSLETREPFLDPQIINYALSLPDKLKISKNGENKYILRKILRNYLPDNLIDNQKIGFSVPINNWLHFQLKNEIYHIIEDASFFYDLGICKEYFVEILNSFYLNKKEYDPHLIWFVYCLYKWYKKWL
jgi:asparagine synthase (glutamine-hydrolysing)